MTKTTLLTILSMFVSIGLALSQDPTPSPTPDHTDYLQELNTWTAALHGKNRTKDAGDPAFQAFVENEILAKGPDGTPSQGRPVVLARYYNYKMGAGEMTASQVATAMEGWGANNFLVAEVLPLSSVRNLVIGNPKFLRSVIGASERLKNPQLLEDFRNSVRGKGITDATYLNWFRAKISAMEPIAAITWLEPEIAALLAQPTSKERDAALIDLRGRFLVLKELAGG
jgi:hypothetical protein